MMINETTKKVLVVSVLLVVVGISCLAVGQEYANRKHNQDLLMFQAGYNDGTISDISNFISECTLLAAESNAVVVFNWLDTKQKPNGVLFRCNGDNATLPLKYSKYHTRS